MESAPLLELRHVSHVFEARGRPFTALQDVSVTVGEGEFIALLGPSGCGKSTLLRVITGLLQPTYGEVIYRGRLLQGVNPHAAIVFQSFALFPWLTVQQNVEIALEALDVPPAQRSRQAEEVLDRVGLDGFEDAFPRELSGGMRQKVGFARAMVVEPELLCMDEPFSALDVLSAEALRRELLEMWQTGAIQTKSILLVTHNIEEAVFLADRILLMDKDPGRVVADLPVRLPHPRVRKSHQFLVLVDRVYAQLAGETAPEDVELGTRPGVAGRTRGLPDVSLNDLTGLLEHLDSIEGKQEDIFRVSDELRLDSAHLLRLIEAAEILGFATVAKGDVALTPLGETFAGARVLVRKEIFAMRYRRLPLVQWLLALLEASEGHRLPVQVVLTALELEFSPQEVANQVERLVSWGRYAEILDLDSATGTLTLEPSPAGVR